MTVAPKEWSDYIGRWQSQLPPIAVPIGRPHGFSPGKSNPGPVEVPENDSLATEIAEREQMMGIGE